MKRDENKTNFHVQLLSKIIDMDRYPFTKLLISHQFTKEEYDELLLLLERLQSEYEEQKEEGLLDFTSLLVEFAGLLNEKLDPTETIKALRNEQYFPELMDEFIKILEKS